MARRRRHRQTVRHGPRQPERVPKHILLYYYMVMQFVSCPLNLMSKQLPPEAIDLIADRFRVLAEPARLRILNTLMRGDLTVTDLVKETGLNQANVSKHLRVLRAAGYVNRRKAGLYAFYAIADPSIEVLCQIMCGRLEEQAIQQSTMLAGSWPPASTPLTSENGDSR